MYGRLILFLTFFISVIKKDANVKPFSYNIERTLDSATPFRNSAGPKPIRKPIDKSDIDIFKPASREFHNINDYGYSSDQYSRPQLPPSLPKKDSFDMFFEAISASVKMLPPKLGAEVKSRISQVIADFELRAICEREAEENRIKAVPAQVTKVLTIDSVLTTETPSADNTNSASPPIAETSPTVAQYVFSYQKGDT